MFASRLNLLRHARNTTPDEICGATQISLSEYEALESGERLPTCEQLLALSDFYNISLDYLVGRSDVSFRFSTDSVMFVSPEEQALLEKYRKNRPDTL